MKSKVISSAGLHIIWGVGRKHKSHPCSTTIQTHLKSFSLDKTGIFTHVSFVKLFVSFKE